MAIEHPVQTKAGNPLCSTAGCKSCHTRPLAYGEDVGLGGDHITDGRACLIWPLAKINCFLSLLPCAALLSPMVHA